jgi:membrane protein
VLTGTLGAVYTRGSALVMPPYVEANTEQFGTLGIILAISTWLIGFAAVVVGAALVGRIVSEDPTVLRVVRTGLDLLRSSWPRRPARGDEPAAPR